MTHLCWSLVLFFLAVVVHEYAHGWMAHQLGDSTAKRSNRLTLNPLAHLDPIGTILLPVTLALFHSPIMFGWARPVPVNMLALRHPRRDIIWVGAAGPIANVLCAISLSLASKLLHPVPDSMVAAMITNGILVNLMLACFNIIPIPPLDGSRILLGLLPRPVAKTYARLEPYGFLIVLVLLYFGLMHTLIWPSAIWLMKRLGVS